MPNMVENPSSTASTATDTAATTGGKNMRVTRALKTKKNAPFPGNSPSRSI